MPPGKPHRIAAPSSTETGLGDLAKALSGIQKAGNRTRSNSGRKRQSNNPSRVPVKEGLRVTRSKLPTQERIERDTASSTVLGDGGRADGLPPVIPSVGELGPSPSAVDRWADAVLGGTPAETGGSDDVDRTEYLSPPPTLHPGRPRAHEARYNPDTKVLHVTFRHGGTYAYYGVPHQTWRALKTNRSFGQTFDRLVLNTYAFEKVSF